MARTRNFATVVYPESAPEDWQEILSQHHVPAFISPLHDEDMNPGGEKKKPHYHVMIMFENVKTAEQAQAVFSQIGGVGLEIVQSIRGYARYLCHLDNPEKVQYSRELVRCFCGADYPAIIGLASDKYKALVEIKDYCRDNHIYSFNKILDYAADERYDWFRILCDSGAFVIKEYLKSMYWDVHNQE
ncbi:MAG: replication protein [Lachnospiraceae bacterium]|nr:replication protein [Lachnospiraceae bacterium]